MAIILLLDMLEQVHILCRDIVLAIFGDQVFNDIVLGVKDHVTEFTKVLDNVTHIELFFFFFGVRMDDKCFQTAIVIEIGI